jgi:hypothetical protein
MDMQLVTTSNEEGSKSVGEESWRFIYTIKLCHLLRDI